MHPGSWIVLRTPGGLELAALVASGYLLLFAWCLGRFIEGYLEGAAEV